MPNTRYFIFFDEFYISLKAVYDFNGKYEGIACLSVCMYVLFPDLRNVLRLKPSYFVYKFIFRSCRLDIKNIKFERKSREIDIKLG